MPSKTVDLTNIAWFAVAFLLCAALGIANNGPFIYFDTGAHLADWKAIKSLFLPSPGATGAGANSVLPSDNTINGSRPPIYGMLIGLAGDILGYGRAFLPQILALLVTLWIVARVFDRGQDRPGKAVAVMIAGASLGSLPFIAVSLMPDLFAPILILILSLIVTRSAHLKAWEIVVLLALALLAVSTHLSHIAIAAGFLGITLLLATFRLSEVSSRTILLVGLVVLAGATERLVFKSLAEAKGKGTEQELAVVYPPFLTARVIVDGPGEAYLRATCLSERVPRAECALLPLLDGQARRGATDIVYGLGERGSYRALPPDLQKQISSGQVNFALAALVHDPGGMFGAIYHNLWRQLAHVSVWMTIPNDGVYAKAEAVARGLPDALRSTRLQERPSWLPLLDRVHHGVYLAALLAVGLLLIPARREVRAFALLLLAGYLINAIVCGAGSQPAPRYGARVAFLLPLAAAFLWTMRRSNVATNDAY